MFRHPLVRSLAYSVVEPAERRAAHNALADALRGDADRDRRAWHLAAAATEPDEELARLLEETAAGRGWWRLGSRRRALERAARLSRDPGAIARRLTRSARLAFWAGDADRAVGLAEEAAEIAPDQGTRANALLELASVRGARTTGHADHVLDTLGDPAELDPNETVRVLLNLIGRRSAALDASGAVGLAPRIVDAARRADSWWRPRGLTVAAAAHLSAGDAEAFDRLLEEVGDDDAALANHALDLVWAERYELVARVLDTSLREGRLAGNRMRIIWNQACLAHLELGSGGSATRRRLRPRQSRLPTRTGCATGRGLPAARWAECMRGAATSKAAAASPPSALSAAHESLTLWDQLFARGALGLLLLGLGRHEEAADELAPAVRLWAGSTHIEPSSAPFVPDLVEAHAHLGDVDEARRVLAVFSDRAERTHRRWALAAAARCEGILAGVDDFTEPFERSLELLASSPLALDRARTQLAYGERLRRAGSRREARTHLRAAHAAFAAVDAAPWTERAAAELRATGETVGPRTWTGARSSRPRSSRSPISSAKAGRTGRSRRSST